MANRYRNNGIYLIQIFEDEWDNDKKFIKKFLKFIINGNEIIDNKYIKYNNKISESS